MRDPAALPETPFLIRLAGRLQAGTRARSGAQASPLVQSGDRHEQHRRYLTRLQRADGGFPGREGDSDLYYTSFAIRGLAMLDGLTPDVLLGVSSYLGTFNPVDLGVIDMMNWLSTAAAVQVGGGKDLTATLPVGWDDAACEKLESLRRDDGGYAKTPEGAAGSTYHSFLAVLTYELLGRSVPRPNRLIQFLFDRQREDGGFVEIGPMKTSGTNPTAAACIVLKLLGALDDEIRADVRGFLTDVKSAEGPYQANRRVPFFDSLSTFTAVLTCQELGMPDAIAAPAIVQQFEHQLEFPTGGMRAAMWDEATDAEYTFYGLGTLALLA